MPKQLVLGKDWLPWTWRFKLSFVRHRRFLTFLGALIVFTTFIVKEGLREQLKDLASSIDSAESVFVIRNDGNATVRWLQRLQEQIDWIAEKIKLKGTTYSGDMIERAHSSSEIIGQVHESLTTSLDNISRLIEKIPHQEASKSEVEKLQKELQELRDHRTAFELAFNREPSMDLVWKLGALLVSTQKLSDEIRDLARDVLENAEKARVRRERVVSITTWASYALYTLGWGLGLLGRIYGVETGGEQ